MPFGLPRRPELGNMRLVREIRNHISEKKDFAVGILYYRNPAMPQHIEFLAEIKSGVQEGDKDLKLPGGNVEKFDLTRKDTLIREFTEEAGFCLHPNNLQPLSRIDQTYINRRGRKTRITAQAFGVEFFEKAQFSPMPGEDIAGYEWVTGDEFKKRVRKAAYRDAIDTWLAELK